MPSRIVWTLLLIASLICGCSKESPKSTQSTPQSTFDAFKAALIKRDFKQAIALHTPNSQNALLFGMGGHATVIAMFRPETVEEISKLMVKHGVVKGGRHLPSLEQRSQGDLNEMFAGVKDKPAYFQELIEWVEKHNPAGEKTPIEIISKAELVNVAIGDNSANGEFKPKDAEAAQATPIQFKKIDGIWFIQMPFGTQE